MKLTLNASNKPLNSEIIIENEALRHLPGFIKNRSKTVLIADETVYRHWEGTLKSFLPKDSGVLLVRGGDQHKNLSTYEGLLKEMLGAGCDRKTLVISLGGGVISDLAGFVASSYMRGVDWVAVPTTLASQTDAAIGGKTGVNLDGYKNMVGSFWPPLAVLIDPQFLKTLDKRELVSGLGEIIKMGFAYDKNILKLVDKLDPENLLGEKLDQVSAQSATAKVDIVNQDMHESGQRKLLNFGHTIGHAVEALSLEAKNPLLHGEAVAIGMVAETKLAELEGVCEPGLTQTVTATLNRFMLPAQVSGVNPEEVSKKILADKKTRNKRTLWTLPTGVGQGIYNHEAKPENVQKAIKFIVES
ncbi:3-dehydroquinate synthase [Candidatus Parcubacteria bacterium]|nr:3-dehydroquinate synthase [Candidatus Parcubacteria bacterium]